MAIVSSYKESCGIAAYTEILETELKKHIDVDVLKLQTNLLRRREGNIIKMADKHISEIANKAAEYDYVNIQFELSLFGYDTESALRRVLKVMKKCKNLLITFHSIDYGSVPFSFRMIASRHPLRNMRNYITGNRMFKFYKSIISQCKKQGGAVLVHTKRDANNIRNIFDFQDVFDFPLTMLREDEKGRKITEKDRLEFKKKYGFNESDKIIGLFGFVSEYKGHITAIKALNRLPSEYKIAIFGAQHPSSIQNFVPVNPYLGHILNLLDDTTTGYSNIDKETYLELKATDLAERVFFAGSTSDKEFLDAMYYCDFVVLPYLEVGQMGSAVAQQAIETKSKALLSNNKVFGELEKYFPNCFLKFDIGNYYELAQKILNYKDVYSDNIDKCMKKYNLSTNAKNYLRIFERKSK